MSLSAARTEPELASQCVTASVILLRPSPSDQSMRDFFDPRGRASTVLAGLTSLTVADGVHWGTRTGAADVLASPAARVGVIDGGRPRVSFERGGRPGPGGGGGGKVKNDVMALAPVRTTTGVVFLGAFANENAMMTR